jgi:hypothetical protein
MMIRTAFEDVDKPKRRCQEVVFRRGYSGYGSGFSEDVDKCANVAMIEIEVAGHQRHQSCSCMSGEGVGHRLV